MSAEIFRRKDVLNAWDKAYTRLENSLAYQSMSQTNKDSIAEMMSIIYHAITKLEK